MNFGSGRLYRGHAVRRNRFGWKRRLKGGLHGSFYVRRDFWCLSRTKHKTDTQDARTERGGYQ